MAISPRAGPSSVLLLAAAVIALLVAPLGGCAAPTASFDVGELALAAGVDEIHSGDEVEVTARVENTGSLAGPYEAELLVDGVVASREQVELEPGQATTVRFVVEAGPPGDHAVALGPLTATLRVTAAPAFVVRNLRLASAPPEILSGDSLEYVVDVVNGGTKAGTHEVALAVDGTERSRKDVTVDPGQASQVSLFVEAGTPGTHVVEVADQRASFTVLAPAAVAVTGLAVRPNPAASGDDLVADVTVGNRGGAIGTLAFDVTVDGKVAGSREVTVEGGAERTFAFALDVPAPGRHTVAVGGLDEPLVVWKITRPANAAVLVNKVKGGEGRLKVKNGDQERDVVVVLASSAKPSKALLAVYVRAKKSATVNGVKDGTYVVYFTYGTRWDATSKAFTSSVEKRRFEDTIRFKTRQTSTRINYTVWTLTLHQAGGDGAPTDDVSDADFPSVP